MRTVWTELRYPLTKPSIHKGYQSPGGRGKPELSEVASGMRERHGAK